MSLCALGDSDQTTNLVNLAARGISAASNALNTYSKVLDQLIHWDIKQRTVLTHITSNTKHSIKAAEHIGRITTFLLDSSDEYESSSMAVYTWCRTASSTLQSYLRLFSSHGTAAIAKAQKTLLFKVLENVVNKMNKAIEKLDACKKSFNDASKELVFLSKPCGEKSHNAATQRQEICTDGYDSAPALMRAYNENEKAFEYLQQAIMQAQKLLALANGELRKEVDILQETSSQLKVSEQFAEVWSAAQLEAFSGLESDTLELIEKCKQYVIKKEAKHTKASRLQIE